jgi:magnesium-transporting ATPase (P-type)
VRVRLGEIIPADIKLMEGNYLLIDESTLTGESCPWRNIFQMSGSRIGIYLND